jgi:hypothetical protein
MASLAVDEHIIGKGLENTSYVTGRKEPTTLTA